MFPFWAATTGPANATAILTKASIKERLGANTDIFSGCSSARDPRGDKQKTPPDEENWPSSLRPKTEWRLVHGRARLVNRKVGLRIELQVQKIIVQLWCRLPRNLTVGIYIPHRISGCSRGRW